MEPRTKSALVVMLAAGWPLAGFAAADAAAPQETETVAVGRQLRASDQARTCESRRNHFAPAAWEEGPRLLVVGRE